jgi:transposase
VEDVNLLVETVFSGLAPLVVTAVEDGGDRIVVRARTPEGPVPCPDCEVPSVRVHGYHQRTVADVPVDARRVAVVVQVRRLVCPTRGCRQTFREQLAGVLGRYQRRTSRLIAQVGAVVRELGGRAAVRVLSALPVTLSRHTALRLLLALPLPERPVPEVLGVDDFALRRRHRYGTVVTCARTRARIDVLPDREGATLEAWLREHPGAVAVCRDGSVTYAAAIRRALPKAVQVADRWHLWHGLCEAVDREVKAHSACWAPALGQDLYQGPKARTTLERWQQIHDLLARGTGLLECARRLQLSLNTIKRYARAEKPERLLRVPKYRPTLVDPYREHLRRRRQDAPGTPVQHLFEEIKALGYTGSLNLLHKYINQGRAEADRSPISPKRLARVLLTRPDNRSEAQQEIAAKVAAACTEMTLLLDHVDSFAKLLTPRDGNGPALAAWITSAQSIALPHLQSFSRGLQQDLDAAAAAVTRPEHNGGTEGVNNKTKLIKRQMYGRASFRLLRHRILLG